MANIDLNKEWAAICREFVEATGYPVDHGDCDAQSIVDKLAKAKAKDDEAKAQLAKAQKYVGNTVKIIQRIGGIAATGASMVFGSPASITMNCINFLIDAGVEYNNITANIESVFGQISSVLQRLQLVIDNQSVMNPAMIRTTHDMLIAIVRVCKLCGIKLKEHRKVWGKIAQFTKLALWSSDGGIKDQLGVLATLEARELQMKSSVTMVAAEVTKRNVEDLKVTSTHIINTVADLNKSSAKDKELAEIKEKLGVHDKILNKEYETYRDKLSAETCAWLKTDRDCQDWLESDKEQPSIMILLGDQGYGTTFALTSMVRILREKYPQGREDANRTTIAHCYVAKTGAKGSKGQIEAGLSVQDVLRVWAWQIVSNDLVYRKDVHGLLKNEAEFKDLSDMWTKLFADQLAKGAAFYLLLDGLQEFENSELEKFAALTKLFASTSGQLRIILSCRPQILEKLQAVNTAMAIMELRVKNKTDFERHVTAKVEDLAIFANPTDEISKLKDFVCKGLVEAVDGNFLLADTKLTEIGTKYDAEEIRRLIVDLKESGANVSNSIDEAIRTCNSTLTFREVEDLNCILRWLIFSEWYLQIYELQAILFLENNRSSPMLAKMIQDKFSSLLTLTGMEDPSNAAVHLKYDSAADHFIRLADQRGLKSSTPQELTQGEIEVVRHFIEKLCDTSIYDRLGLASFFDQKLAQVGACVAVDSGNAHAMIAQVCLRVLIEGPMENTKGLLDYAAVHVMSHLQKIDADTVDPAVKAKLGSPLIKLFRDDAVIARQTEIASQPSSYMDNAVQQVVQLLRSSAVMKGVASSEPELKEWVASVLADNHPELATLKDSAKVEAKLWFTSKSSIGKHFHWLNGYRNKIESTERLEARMTECPENADLSEEEIEGTMAQAQKLLGIDKLDATGLRAVGLVYRESGHLYKAIDLLEKALEADPSLMLTHTELAITYGMEVEGGPSPDYEKSLYHEEIVIEHLRGGKQLLSDEDTEVPLNFLLGSKAHYLRKLGRYREAQQIFEDLIREDPTDDDIRRRLVDTLCEAEYFSEVVALFQALYDEEDENDTKGSSLSRFFVDNAYDSDYHSNVVKAFKRAERLPDIQRHYRWVIEDGCRSMKNGSDNEIDSAAYTFITYYFGVLLRRHGELADKEEALTIWEGLIDRARKENDFTVACAWAMKDLSDAYITAAVEHGHGSEGATLILAKLDHYLLVKSGEDFDDWESGLSPAQLRSLLGRYYHKVGQIDEAKKQIRPDVELGLKLLTDETTENDYQGYRKLGDAFMNSGDDDNARAAWSLIHPYPEDQSTATPLINGAPRTTSPDGISDQQDVNTTASTAKDISGNGADDDDELVRRPSRTLTARAKKRVGPLNNYCDGSCGVTWTYTDGFYICRQCLDVQFDEPCYNKLRSGELDCDKCNPSHEFLRVDPWSPESEERFKSGKVLVGERVLGVNDWLQEIRRDWDLPAEETTAALGAAVAVEVAA